MKLKGIETFDVNLLTSYVSALFLESNKIRKYFPNIDGETSINETLNLLESQNEIKIIKETYSKDCEFGRKASVEITTANILFDKYIAEELINYCDESKNSIISKIVLDYMNFKSDFEKNKIDRLLEEVCNKQKTK